MELSSLNGTKGSGKEGWTKGSEEWLIRSPSPLVDPTTRKPFLEMRYIEPALASIRPRTLNVSVAPIDLSYGEKAVIRSARFLAKLAPAWRFHKLFDISTDFRTRIEDVVGQPDSDLKQAAPVHQLALQASMGDVRVMIPCRRGMSQHGKDVNANRIFKRMSRIRRSRSSIYRLTSQQPMLVIVFGGFSLSTQIDEFEEAIQNTIILNHTLSIRRQNQENENGGCSSESHSPRADTVSVFSDDRTEAVGKETGVSEMRAQHLSVQLWVQAFLGDPFSPSEMIFHRSVQLLKKMTIQVVCNSRIQSSIIGEAKHEMQVRSFIQKPLIRILGPTSHITFGRIFLCFVPF